MKFPARVLVALALVAALCAACGSGGASTTSTTSAPSTTSIPSHATSVAEITHAYEVLFDLADPAVAPKLAVVQEGQQLQATFTKELHSALAKEAHGAKVHSVNLLGKAGCDAEGLPSPCAKVDYDILAASGKVLLANSVGFAVWQQPSWKVSKVTICTLLTLANGNTAPEGC